MTRTLHCGEVVEGCAAVFRGENDDEVMRQARAHAANAHGLHAHPPEKVTAVRGKIRDEPPPPVALLTAGRLIHEGKGSEAIAILERTGVLPPAAEVTRLRYLAIAHTQHGLPARALEILQQAQTLAAEHGSADDQAWIASARAGAHVKAGSPAEAVLVLTAAVANCEQGSVVDAVLHFRLLADLGQALVEAGQNGAALEALERSLAMAEPYVDASSRAARYAALAEAQQAKNNAGSAEYYKRRSVYVREDIRMLEGITDTRAKAAELRNREAVTR